MNKQDIIPFVKWAGGKRQLLPEIKKRMPETYGVYYEPFLGGGALLFDLQPEHAVCGDINMALVNTYNRIAELPESFLTTIGDMDEGIRINGKPYYMTLREYYNNKLVKNEYDMELAALFVFLNKHCFNGLYRVNSKGLFNVPYNNSMKASVDPDAIRETAEYLKSVTILHADFETTLENAGIGDFVFLDSPYAPLQPDSFTSYNKEGFGMESHRRLARLFDDLTARGCYCMATNHNTEFVRELYGNKGYRMDVVSAKRMINADGDKRTGEEIIICNY